MNALDVYDGLTERRTRFLRVDELCRLAVQAGHLPDPAADAGRPLKEKKHLELAQGAFLAEILGDPDCGTHLCHSMLLPRKESLELQKSFEKSGNAEFPGASLRREGKIYLWDYGAIPNEAARFENLVALHLLKICHFWSDTGEGEFELYFLRNKERQEIDFLIVRDGIPWLPVEVKLSDSELSPNWKKFAPMLPCKRGLQIVRSPEWKLHGFGDTQVLIAGAAEALRYLA